MSPAATTACKDLHAWSHQLGQEEISEGRETSESVLLSSMEEMPIPGRCCAKVLERLPPTH